MIDQLCSTCQFIQTSIRQIGSGPRELVVTCRKGHAPIWLFSGDTCQDYQPKSINQTQEQK